MRKQRSWWEYFSQKEEKATEYLYELDSDSSDSEQSNEPAIKDTPQLTPVLTPELVDLFETFDFLLSDFDFEAVKGMYEDTPELPLLYFLKENAFIDKTTEVRENKLTSYLATYLKKDLASSREILGLYHKMGILMPLLYLPGIENPFHKFVDRGFLKPLRNILNYLNEIGEEGRIPELINAQIPEQAVNIREHNSSTMQHMNLLTRLCLFADSSWDYNYGKIDKRYFKLIDLAKLILDHNGTISAKHFPYFGLPINSYTNNSTYHVIKIINGICTQSQTSKEIILETITTQVKKFLFDPKQHLSNHSREKIELINTQLQNKEEHTSADTFYDRISNIIKIANNDSSFNDLKPDIKKCIHDFFAKIYKGPCPYFIKHPGSHYAPKQIDHILALAIAQLKRDQHLSDIFNYHPGDVLNDNHFLQLTFRGVGLWEPIFQNIFHILHIQDGLDFKTSYIGNTTDTSDPKIPLQNFIPPPSDEDIKIFYKLIFLSKSQLLIKQILFKNYMTLAKEIEKSKDTVSKFTLGVAIVEDLFNIQLDFSYNPTTQSLEISPSNFTELFKDVEIKPKDHTNARTLQTSDEAIKTLVEAKQHVITLDQKALNLIKKASNANQQTLLRDDLNIGTKTSNETQDEHTPPRLQVVSHSPPEQHPIHKNKINEGMAHFCEEIAR